MRRFLRDQGLSLFFLALFVVAIVGQSIAGFAQNNDDLTQHGMPAVSYGEFISTSAFLVDVAENWQSEFLQFFLFIFATIWLIQRGSPESKNPGDEGVGSDDDQMLGQHARHDSPAGPRRRVGGRPFIPTRCCWSWARSSCCHGSHNRSVAAS